MHNIKSFENYLKKSEEGKYKNTALAIVDSLRWEKAKKDNNVTSHERYLDWLFEESALKYKEEALLYLSQNKSIADFPKYSINGFKYIQSPIDSILMTGYSIKINGDEYRVFKDTKFFVFLDNLLDNLNVKLPVYRENFVSSVKKGDQISMTILDINGETDVVVEIAIISTKVILDQINEIK